MSAAKHVGRAACVAFGVALVVVGGATGTACFTLNIGVNSYPEDVPWCSARYSSKDVQDYDRLATHGDDAPVRDEIKRLWGLWSPKVAILHVGVDADGPLRCIRVERSSGDRRVDIAGARGAVRMTYTAAVKDGAPVPGWTHVVVRGYTTTDAQACNDGLAWACVTAEELAIDERRYADARALDERGCALHDARSCTELADLPDGDRGGPPDLPRARALLENACDGKHYEACRMLAYDVEHPLDGAAPDHARALTLNRIACSDGFDGLACNNAGVNFARGLGAPIDDERATAFFEEACAHGSWSGCASAGSNYVNGHGVPRDRPRGRRLLSHACNRGDRASCNLLAGDIAGTDGFDAPAALDGHRHACALGDWHSCRTLLWDRAHGADVGTMPKSAEETFAGLDAHCADKDADVHAADCVNAASMLRCGWGRARDDDAADALLDKMCAVNARHGCVAAGKRVEKRGDKAMAAALFLRACNEGNGDGCSNAGRLEDDPTKKRALEENACVHGTCDGLEALLVDTDPARARTIAQAECDSGGPTSCAILAGLVAKDAGDPMAAAKASALLRRACDRRNAKACRELAARYRSGEGVRHDDASADALEKRADQIAGDVDGCGYDVATPSKLPTP